MLKQSLQLKLGQSLTMTPQLQQAIRLLQMPTLELQAHIQDVLESNVMLEQEESEEEADILTSLTSLTALESTPTVDVSDTEVEIIEQPWADRPGTGSDAGRAEDDEDRERELADEHAVSLREHLLEQLELAGLRPADLPVAAAIVDALDDDGYLKESLSDIADSLRPQLELDEDEVERVLLLVQMLEPAGIAARDLTECLLLQLAQLDTATPGLAIAQRIASQHLDLLGARNLEPLHAALQTDSEIVETAIALVRACHPRPGSLISAVATEYIVPDVFVRRTERGWSVELNPGTLPRVRVNDTYAGMLGRGGAFSTLRAQLQEARWLLKSLEIRNDTLLKVARAIVERQTDFLAEGEELMRPMILKDIALAIDMHESTISRVTSGKYLHTPRGVFELRYFFSSQVEGGDGQGTSSTAIRAKIRKLIRDEDSARPLSDNRIAELLSEQGIPVARRTVAKYREALGIESSAERKRNGAS